MDELDWIEVAVDPGGTSRRRFRGRWLLPPSDRNCSRLPGRHASICYGVAVGEEGAIYVYSYHSGEAGPRRLEHHESVAAALTSGVPADVVAEAIGADRTRMDRALSRARRLFPADALPVLLLTSDAEGTRGLLGDLEEDGYDVAVAAPEHGLRELSRRRPEVVFLDVGGGAGASPAVRRLLDAAGRRGSPPVVLIVSRGESRNGVRRWRFQLPPGAADGKGGAPGGPRSASAA